MRFVAWVIFALIIAAGSAQAQTLSWQGVGPVKLGMTVAEAERAVNAKLRPMDLAFSKECYVTGRTDGKDEALSYVVVNGKIVVMTVFLPNEKPPTPNIVDKDGVGVGSTEDDIIRAYGRIQKELAPDFRETKEALAEAAQERARRGITEPEPSPQYWIEAESADHRRMIIFQIRDQKVLYLRVGLKPQIMSSEDCI